MTKLNTEEIMELKIDVDTVKGALNALSGCNYKKDIAKIKDKIAEKGSRLDLAIIPVLDELVQADPAILSKLCEFAKGVVSSKSGNVLIVEFVHQYSMLDKLYSFCIVSGIPKTADLFMLIMQIIDINCQCKKLLTTARKMNLVAEEKEVDEW